MSKVSGQLDKSDILDRSIFQHHTKVHCSQKFLSNFQWKQPEQWRIILNHLKRSRSMDKDKTGDVCKFCLIYSRTFVLVIEVIRLFQPFLDRYDFIIQTSMDCNVQLIRYNVTQVALFAWFGHMMVHFTRLNRAFKWTNDNECRIKAPYFFLHLLFSIKKPETSMWM